MTAPATRPATVTIVGRVLAATGDALLLDDGADRLVWVPTPLAEVAPLGEPLPPAQQPEFSDTDFVEVTLSPDLAQTLGLSGGLSGGLAA